MRFTSLASALSVAALACAQTQPAPVVANNPIGAQYVATLPNSNKTTVRGSVRAQSASNGQGVDFQVSITGLPSAGGPFLYHIHDQPVPSNGNCTGTLAHLDPFKRGEQPPCDSTKKETCQVGDLSGKYGKINGTSFAAAYTDLYASLKPGIGAFFGNRSIVVHYANTTRITCANFTQICPGGNSTTPTNNTIAPTLVATPTPSVAQQTRNAAANNAVVGTGALLGAIFAFAL